MALRLSLLFACLVCAAFAAQAQTVAVPVFSVASGSYTTAQLVSISDATPGAAIYYTTNGSTPTTSSFLYAGPIPVHQNLTIEAFAVAKGGGQSAVVTADYRVSGVVAAISTIAGTGVLGYTGDGGPATAAELDNPGGVAVDRSGQVYVAETNNQVVRKIATSGVITTFAGNGTQGFSGDGGPATSAELSAPWALAFDAAGNLYISDTGNERVRKVTPAGIITTVVGNGVSYSGSNDGDGGPATSAQISQPLGLAFDAAGDLFIADNDLANRIREVTPVGIITTFAGTGAPGFGGDGGMAINAEFDGLFGLAFDAAGNLYIADGSNCRIRMVNPATVISTIAGNGNCNTTGVVIGDGGQATSAELGGPTGVEVDAAGVIYVADGVYRVRAISPSGEIETVAGDGTSGFTGDGEPASSYSLDLPEGLATDANGNVYIADWFNQRVRELTFSDSASLAPGALVFGALTFSPAAAVLQGSNEAVTIIDTISYSGATPTGAVTYSLNGVDYTATCTGSASPQTCSAVIPAATIAALPATTYTASGSFAGNPGYVAASASGAPFSVFAGAACTVPSPSANSMNVTYFTLAETDRDTNSGSSSKLQGETSSNFVLPGIGPNGFPVFNPSSTAITGFANVPLDQLSDGEITWWSPALNTGASGGASDLVQTGNGVVSFPFANDTFFPPNGTGANDFNGFQTAVLAGTLVMPTTEAISFSIASDDSAFIYLDGQIVCSDGVLQAASTMACITPVVSAGAHTMEVFFADLAQVGSVLDLNITTPNVSVGTISQVAFGPVALSPSATEPYGTDQAITLTDTLAYPGPQPMGSVTFVLNGVSYMASCTGAGSPQTCTAVVPAATIAALPGGQYSVMASFSGDCTYGPIDSKGASFTITSETTTTELAASATTLSYGQALNLAATVNSAAGLVSTGTVSFYNGTFLLNGAPLSASGVATISFAPAVGSYSFTARYTGSVDDLPSTSSPPVLVTVLPASTTTTISPSQNPASLGSEVTFTLSVQGAGGSATGSVALLDGTTILSVLPLNSAGIATYGTSSLALGPHNLTAVYAANGNFTGSVAMLTENIVPPPTFTIAASGTLHLVTQHHGAITITVTPLNGFSGIVTLSCGALPQWATCEWGSIYNSNTQLPVTAGSASTQLVVDTSSVLDYESSLRTNRANPEQLLFPGLAFPALLLLLQRKRGAIRLAVCLLALLPLVSLSGCTGMLPYSVAPGTYSIPIVGVSGTIQSSGTLTLVVTK